MYMLAIVVQGMREQIDSAFAGRRASNLQVEGLNQTLEREKSRAWKAGLGSLKP